MKNKFNKLINIFLISTIFIIIYILIKCEEKYISIVLIPIAYLIFTFAFFHTLKGKNIKGIIYKSSIIIIFIKYVITPFSIVYMDKTFSNSELKNINFSVLLMIGEMFFVYVVYYLFNTTKKQETITKTRIQPIKNKIIITIFLILGILIICMINYKVLIPSNVFIVDEEYEEIKLEFDNAGIVYILVECVTPCIFIILYSFALKKYTDNENKIYIILSLIAVIVLMALMTSTKRWNMLFATIIGIYFLIKSYPRFPKFYSFIIIAIMSISIISITVYKFSWVVKNSDSPIYDISIHMIDAMQSYFSGPTVISESLDMVDTYRKKITIETFVNDYLGSIPGICSFVNQENRINHYYNLYKGRNNDALIMPMMGIGYAYFPIFPFIFTIICEILVMVLNSKEQLTSKIEYKYIYIYLGLYMAMCLGFNTQIIFYKILVPFSLLFILFKINDKVLYKKERKENDINNNTRV